MDEFYCRYGLLFFIFGEMKMLEQFPTDIFRTIWLNLNRQDINSLTLVNKNLRNVIRDDNVFWKNQFEIHFHYLMNKVTEKGEPENWYSIFEKNFIKEYELDIKDGEKRKEDYEKMAFFIAAKNGNEAEFKKFHQQPDFWKKEIYDKRGYRVYDWLYRNGHQKLLDTLFNDADPNMPEQDKFSLAILCNQEAYIEQHLKTDWDKDFNGRCLISAVKLGSLKIVNLLLDKCDMADYLVYRALEQTAKMGNIDIFKAIHAKIIATENFSSKKGKYAAAIYDVLKNAIRDRRQEFFRQILSIYSKEISGGVLDYLPYDARVRGGNNLLIAEAAKVDNPIYVEMLLKEGTKPNIVYHEDEEKLYSALETAIYFGNYDTLTVLLKNGADFNAYDYIRVKDWLNDSHHDKNHLLSRPDIPKEIDPRLRALVELMIYKREINQEAGTPLSFISGVFHVERPQDKPVKRRVCDILLDVITEKSPTTQLDVLTTIEQDALTDKGSRLAGIYQKLLGEIETIKAREVTVESKQSVDLNKLD